MSLARAVTAAAAPTTQAVSQIFASVQNAQQQLVTQTQQQLEQLNAGLLAQLAPEPPSSIYRQSVEAHRERLLQLLQAHDGKLLTISSRSAEEIEKRIRTLPAELAAAVAEESGAKLRELKQRHEKELRTAKSKLMITRAMVLLLALPLVLLVLCSC